MKNEAKSKRKRKGVILQKDRSPEGWLVDCNPAILVGKKPGWLAGRDLLAVGAEPQPAHPQRQCSVEKERVVLGDDDVVCVDRFVVDNPFTPT